jgi:hypothetical protein
MRCAPGHHRRGARGRHWQVPAQEVDHGAGGRGALGDSLSDRRDALCGGARHVVRGSDTGNQRRGRPHDLHFGDALLRRRRRRPHLRTALDFPRPDAAGDRSPDAGALALRQSLLFRHGASERPVLPGAETYLDEPAEDLRACIDRTRARGGAGQPIRHRAEQHAARFVHVPRRWPAGRHESPLQRNDEFAGRRGRRAATRRRRRRRRRSLRARQFDFHRKRQDYP